MLRAEALDELTRTGRGASANGIGFLKELRPQMERTGQEAAFQGLLADLLAKYNNRRAFLEMLRDSRLGN